MNPPDHITYSNPFITDSSGKPIEWDEPIEWREGDVTAIRRAILLEGEQSVWDGKRDVHVWYEEKEGKFGLVFIEKNKEIFLQVENLEEYFKESKYPFRTFDIPDY